MKAIKTILAAVAMTALLSSCGDNETFVCISREIDQVANDTITHVDTIHGIDIIQIYVKHDSISRRGKYYTQYSLKYYEDHILGNVEIVRKTSNPQELVKYYQIKEK